ncbi:MAG: S-adenosylmethionine:tRNA ribosyltransferase-isomerase, partial [Alphaproteobacteria bacterium]|nr:S-adenosylmethionine:tRNA ribosyltransferase-isomerase [Alphaproteobacteria bacterium]
LDRASASIRHLHFADIRSFLTSADALVLNQTRVMPARLKGRRADSGGARRRPLVVALSAPPRRA